MSSIADYETMSLAEFYTRTAIANAPKHTGRLPLSNAESVSTVPSAPLFAPEPYLVPERVAEKIHYRHVNTDLNTEFFSERNLEQLQQMIQSAVFGMIGARIDRQSDPDLSMVMRSYYLQYGRNDPSKVSEELAELNQRVVGFCANRIAVEVEAYRYYRKDILDFPAPIESPMNVTIYGTRTGELKSFF